jgi:hypothetical protein
MQGTVTPATSIVPDPTILDRLAVELMTANRTNEERISRGYEIALAGGVERTAEPFVFLVASQSTPEGHYRVTRGLCNCPDAQRRSAHECKHCWACRLAVQAERLEAEPADLLDVDAPVPFALTDLALYVLDGEPCALPAQCPRCGQEPAILSHIDHLGPSCLADELFGTAPAA